MKNRWRGLAAYYKPYLGLFFSDMAFAILGAAVTLVIPLIVRYITNQVIPLPSATAIPIIVRLGLLLLVLVAVECVSNFYITYFGHMMGTKIERDLREDIFDHYQKLSFTFYDNHKTGELLSRITSDLFDITELLHHGPEDVVVSVLKVAGSLIILSFINLPLTIVAFIFIPLITAFVVWLNTKMESAFRENRARMADINGQIEDSLSGIRVVQSFGNEKIEQEKFHEGNQRFVESKRLRYWFMAMYNSGVGVMTTLITIVVLLAGTGLITSGAMVIADLVTFLLYINNFTEPIKKLINDTEMFQNGLSGYVRFREVMDIEPDIQDAPDAVGMERAEGDISFDNVSFKYEENQDTILSHINLQVKAGDYLAIVGSSGVGKTTLCSLIPRFYDVDGGAVLLDGTDIRRLRLSDLRRQIGIVQQDVYLFADTVIENIRYGRPDATDEEVIEAARLADADEFIRTLSEGYETYIGENGVKLSGGQQQRLSIARVFLKNPPVLIFDEATSSLDNESERIVQHSLEKLARGRTTFVIAHRLSTIRNAQKILVLSAEGIVEEGTHEELLAKNGIYTKLYENR